MRATLVLSAVFAIGFAATALATEVQIGQISLPVTRDQKVRLEFPVGELRVEAATDSRVTLDIRAHCRNWGGERCDELARRIHAESEVVGGELRLKVAGYPKFHSGAFNLHGVLRLPRDLALKIEMGVGELRIAGIEGDVDADLGVGAAEIRASGRTLRSAEVETGVGDANVRAAGEPVKRRSFIGGTASWDQGKGRSAVNLHVGVGEATVRVE